MFLKFTTQITLFIDGILESVIIVENRIMELKSGTLTIFITAVLLISFFSGCYKSTSEYPEIDYPPKHFPTPTPFERPRGKPFILPTKGYMMSSFGMRNDPKTGKTAMHHGIDISHWFPNQEIWAAADGVVEFSGLNSGYGITVKIRHNNQFNTMYNHLKIAFALVGARVETGETIGIMGATGRTTGVHVHFEVHKNGDPVDPMEYLDNPVFLTR